MIWITIATPCITNIDNYTDALHSWAELEQAKGADIAVAAGLGVSA